MRSDLVTKEMFTDFIKKHKKKYRGVERYSLKAREKRDQLLKHVKFLKGQGEG